MLKSMERLSSGGRQPREPSQPSGSDLRITPFYVLPVQALPRAEVDLAQRRSGPAAKTFALRECGPDIERALEITAVNGVNRFCSQRLNELYGFLATARIEWWVELPAEGPGELCLRVPDEEEFGSHLCHTPQKSTAISVSWFVAPKQSPVTPPRRVR